MLVLPGCGAKATSPSDAAPIKPARSEVTRGPVRVTVEVQPSKLRLSDVATLTLTIDHEEGVTVEKPPFGSTLGSFAIQNFHEPLPKIKNGREEIQQVYTLEPTETGKLRIDPISVKFTDRRPKGDGRSHTVATEPLSVEVTSLVGDKAPSLGDLHPPAGPFALLSHISYWLWAILMAIVAAMAAAWWIWRRSRPETTVAAVVLSPEELANIELDKLVASGLAESDIKLFYVELTSVVRRYIERATTIRAPEQTTEEFLREVSRTQTFGRDDCSRLRDFLESADLVKFAAHRPQADDIAESIHRARLFIGMQNFHAAIQSRLLGVGDRK